MKYAKYFEVRDAETNVLRFASVDHQETAKVVKRIFDDTGKWPIVKEIKRG